MANKSMTKSEIIDYLAEQTDTTKKTAGEFLDSFINLAYKEAKNEFVIPGLGKIKMTDRKERKGRNPQTGEEITIPARKALKFSFSKQAKDAILPNK